MGRTRSSRQARPRRRHRRGRRRRRRRVLPRRHVRRRRLRGSLADRRARRLADDRVQGASGHCRSRRAVLPPRHPPDLRHASRGARPLRPGEARLAPDARVAGQPVRVPNKAAVRRGSRRRVRSRRCPPRSRSPLSRSSRGKRCSTGWPGRRRSTSGSRSWRWTQVQGPGAVSLDHRDHRVHAGGRQARVGALDPPDLRARVSKDPAAGATTYNSRIGLQGNLERLLDRAPAARVHRNAPVHASDPEREGWTCARPPAEKGRTGTW